MDMLGKVRRMKMRDGISISQIAKRTALARVDLNKTVYTFSINVSRRVRKFKRASGKLKRLNG